MEDSVVKIRVKTVADANADKGVKDVNKEIVKDTAKTNNEIEGLIAERKKKYEEYIEGLKNSLGEEDANYEKNKYEELYQKYLNGGRIPSGDGTRPVRERDLTFYDKSAKQYLEIPQFYEDMLKTRNVEEEIKQIEEEITEEKFKQDELAKSTNKTEQKRSKFLDSLKSGAKNLGSKLALGADKVVSGLSIILNSIIKLFAGGLVLGALGLIAGTIAGIAALVGKTAVIAKEGSSEVQKKMNNIGAMIESICYTILPIVESIVNSILNGIIQALRFIQHVVYALTKVDIFKNAGDRLAKNMEKAQKSTSKMAKDLMGFDEVNKLSEDGSVGALGGFNPNAWKPIDLSIDENYFGTMGKNIETLEGKFYKYKESVQETLSDPKMFEKAFGNWAMFAYGLGLTWDGFLGVISGAWETLKLWWRILCHFIQGDWDKLLKEDLPDAWRQFWKNIGSWIEMIFGIVMTIGGFIYGTVQSILDWIWEKIKTFFKDVWTEIKLLASEIWGDLVWLYNKCGEILEGIKNFIVTKIIAAWDWVGEKIQWVIDKILLLKDNALQWLKDKFEGIKNTIQGIIDKFKTLLNWFKGGATVNIDANTSGFMGKISDAIKGLGEVISLGVESGINTIKNGLGSLGSKAKNFGSSLAKTLGFDGGGIILPQPGHGVPINAVMSERRAEAIIPLENPEAMETLGQAIGRYVNIAIDNVMKVDGRVLATATNNATSMNNFLRNRR